MIRVISAEFESIDRAEYVSKSIKEKVDGITKIIIKSSIQDNPEKNLSALPFTAPEITSSTANSMYISSLQFPQFFNGSDNEFPNGYEDKSGFDNKVLLEVHCENNSIMRVSNIITALGGLRVKKN